MLNSKKSPIITFCLDINQIIVQIVTKTAEKAIICLVIRIFWCKFATEISDNTVKSVQ